MKFRVNILSIIVILAAIVIPSGTCQEETSMEEILTDEMSTNETSTNETIFLNVILKSIIYVPDRNVLTSCPEGQRKDHRGTCRRVL
ncbi:hypothetical protein ACFW04_008368 [Cataglyphis niger]